MATASVLEPGTLSVIAEQLAERPTEAGQSALAAGLPLEIGESFPVWMLGLQSTSDLEFAFQSATWTGYWHHQIRHAGVAKEFAKSRPQGPGPRDWVVEEIVTSPMAERVDAAIEVLDREVRDEAQVRMLHFPAHFVDAFWIGSGTDSRLLLIYKPESTTGLDYGRIYSGYEFLDRLARQPYVIGIPPHARPQ